SSYQPARICPIQNETPEYPKESERENTGADAASGKIPAWRGRLTPRHAGSGFNRRRRGRDRMTKSGPSAGQSPASRHRETQRQKLIGVFHDLVGRVRRVGDFAEEVVVVGDVQSMVGHAADHDILTERHAFELRWDEETVDSRSVELAHDVEEQRLAHREGRKVSLYRAYILGAV